MESEFMEQGMRADFHADARFSFVLFNRQPSLHKMSMMSHRVRLMPYSSEYSILLRALQGINEYSLPTEFIRNTSI
jgi:hypothetical protein